MSFLDARAADLPPLEADVCVVGAGAAGITLARELERAGRDVLLVESGGLAPEEPTQALADMEIALYPVREDFMSRARYYGGSCNLWAGRSMRFAPRDLEERPWVPGSGWPLGWDEIGAWYPRAAELLGLPALERFELASWEPRLTPDERALFAPPLAPTISLWARSPRRFGAANRRTLSRSERVRVLLHANATELATSEAGDAVAAVRLATLGGRRLEARARSFVLACGGIENARLLLVSRDRHPAGLGNGSDLVGRFFMDHPRAVFGSVRLRRPARFPLLRSRPLPDGKVQFGLRLAPELQAREELLNHYVTFEKKVSGYAEASYQSFVQTMKVVLRRGYAGRRSDLLRKGRLGDIPGMVYLLTPKELLPHAVWRWGTLLRERLRPAPAEEERIVVYFCEQPPRAESRVSLGERRDALGMPRTVLSWAVDGEVTRSVLALQRHLADELERRGAGTLVPGEGEPRYSDASHHMGTTRMGRTPAEGVVDTDGRVHGVRNLYCAGSSVFPSCGHQNPTLTLLALTLRLAAHLAR